MAEERILIVDDQPMVGQTCTEILTSAGYRVRTANGGREALARLEREQFDVVLADLKMPDVDGLTVLRRARAFHPGLAAIMMTSYGSMENAIEALRAGAQDFLLKPFDPDELLRAVREALAARRREQAAVEEQAARQRLTDVLERITDGIVALDTDWRYTYLNQQAALMLNRQRPEDLIGKNYWEEYPEAAGTPFALAYERALREQTPITLEEYYAPWDRWFENRIYPFPGG